MFWDQDAESRLQTILNREAGGPAACQGSIVAGRARAAKFHWPPGAPAAGKTLLDRCAGEILKAAKTGKSSDIVEATRSLKVALRRENWL
jgi:hypothetical protein